MKAIIIKADGTEPHLKEIAGDLESLQAEVGGYIEMVPVSTPGIAIWANEEGHLLDLPYHQNMLALRDLGWKGGSLRGDILVTGMSGDDVTDVPQEALAAIL